MSHKEEIFADLFAQKANFATRMEARTKIVFTVVALVINLLSTNIYTSLSIAAFCLAVLAAIKVPLKLLVLRLAMPLVMAVIVLVIQLFFYGTTPLFAFSFGWLRLTGYQEGLVQGLLIMCRVIGGVSLILFLSMSTPANRLLMAAAWFRVPKIFVELTLLVYRYIFVLIEEVATIKSAQKVRLGYHGWGQSIRSLGVLGGSLILRAYDRADRVFEAMSARGYSGNIKINYHSKLGVKDITVAMALGALLLLFYTVGQL